MSPDLASMDEFEVSMLPVCLCGHVAELHRHYRASTDCAICGRQGCPTYRDRPPLWNRFREWFRGTEQVG